MSFYGNITNTSKTTFSFDLIYDTRWKMDENADVDGVFLGRYVLVDYDEEPIKAYYDTNTDAFYSTANFSVASRIEPRENTVYQDLHNVYDESSFYKWNKSTGRYYKITSNSPYAERFATDVSKYGRGYDSTVWVKRFDTATNKYKYAMIAELNAVVPTLHLVVDKPTTVPTTPYFDRDTTNIDYYLHMQSDYGTQVKRGNSEYSDEKIQRTPVYWAPDVSGYPTITQGQPEIIDADIYYNKDGFAHDVRTYIPENKDNEYTQNTINYSMAQSGRLYGADADQGVYKEGVPADDIYEWYFRLPVLGNTVCSMWDKLYGYRDDNKRFLNKALKRNDTEENLVTYDKETLIGMLNTTQDLLGYHFIPFDDDHYEDSIITDIDATVDVTLKYGNGIAEQTETYPVLDCLFYDPNNIIANVERYYHYVYDPTYTQVDGATLNPDQIYYYKDAKGIYHLANQASYQAKDADGNLADPLYETYYTQVPRWIMRPLVNEYDDTIYGILAQIHTLLGTDADEVRNFDSVRGIINIIKDIISRVDLNLEPGRLLHTNNQGIIETADTYFPSASWDKDELLAGDGTWVSRFASVKVRENSDNANRKIPKVVEFEDTDAASANAPVELKNSQAELVSDNQRYNDGTVLKNYKQHDPNTLILATRDKWIKLHPDTADDSIEFEHTQSPLVNRLAYQQDDDANAETAITGPVGDANSFVDERNFKANEDGTEIILMPDQDESLVYDESTPDRNDNRFTIPYITVDNAGHVVAASTKNYHIPNSFKKVLTSTIADTVEDASKDVSGVSIAETVTDTLNVGPQNRWIDIATNENNDVEGNQSDGFTIGHRLAPTLTQSVALNGVRRTSNDEIPTVYRYGLPQDKSITSLDEVNGNEAANTFNIPYIEIDKAGHVVNAETHTVEIPDNYTTINVGAASTSVGSMTTTGTAGNTSDSLAGAETLKAETLTEALTFNPSNKWIRVKGINTKGSDIIEIGHELHSIIASTSTEDLDSSSQKDTFTTQTVEWDNAGHIISHDTKTWTLPNSLRNIKVTGTSAADAVADATSVGGTVQADTTFDTFDFKPSNIWIKLNADVNNDEISFGHLVRPIDTTLVATSDLNVANEDTFTTQELTWDEAGHIRAETTRTIILPYTYETVKVITDEATVTNLEATDGTIIADNTHDEITYTMGNKWVVLAAAPDNDTITFGHLVQDIDTPTSNEDLDNNDTFDLYDFTYDEAGHIRSKTTHTVKIPKVEIGNKWIVQEDTANNINLSHLLQGTSGDHVVAKAEPKFGDIVTIQGYETDEAGHVVGYPTYEVVIPKGSISNTTSSGKSVVITDVKYTDTTGAISTTSQTVGSLVLSDYALGTDGTVVTASDMLKTAIAKLQVQINNTNSELDTEVELRSQAITSVNTRIDEEVDALNESINSEASTRKTAVSTLTTNLNKEIQDRKDADQSIRDDFAAADTAINQALTSQNTSIRQDFASADAAEKQARENAISDINGKITTINNTLNSLSPIASMTFDDLYTQVIAKITSEYELVPKTVEPEPNPEPETETEEPTV